MSNKCRNPPTLNILYILETKKWLYKVITPVPVAQNFAIVVKATLLVKWNNSSACQPYLDSEMIKSSISLSWRCFQYEPIIIFVNGRIFLKWSKTSVSTWHCFLNEQRLKVVRGLVSTWTHITNRRQGPLYRKASPLDPDISKWHFTSLICNEGKLLLNKLWIDVKFSRQ